MNTTQRQILIIVCTVLTIIILIIIATAHFTSVDYMRRSAQVKHVTPLYRPVNIPSTYIDPTAQSIYVSQHYWDNVDFSDPLWLRYPDIFEKVTIDYLDILNKISRKPAQESIKMLLKRASTPDSMRNMVLSLLEKNLCNTETEELYIPVMEYIISSPQIDSIDKIASYARLEKAVKNRPDSIAAGFIYTDSLSTKSNFYDLVSPYTLLILYDQRSPLDETVQKMGEDYIISKFIDMRVLAVMALYTDSGVKAWEKTAVMLPKSWIAAYDSRTAVKKDSLYDTDALPAMYLLNNHKRVIIKNATLKQVEWYLAQRLMEDPDIARLAPPLPEEEETAPGMEAIYGQRETE